MRINTLNNKSSISILVISVLIFSIGFASAAFNTKFEIKLSDLLVVFSWFVAIFGAWIVAKKQLILRHRSAAVKSMMQSNREITSPLAKLAKITHFERQTQNYYAATNSKLLFDDLAKLHDEIRKLLIKRTQSWEEHRISVMPTENEFLFVKYLLEDLKEDIYDLLLENRDIEAATESMDLKTYKDFLEHNLRFRHLGGICIIIMVLSLDYGNLLQNKYLSSIFNTQIPNRIPLDGSPVLLDYNTKELVSSYQAKRDKHFIESKMDIPRFYSHIGIVKTNI